MTRAQLNRPIAGVAGEDPHPVVDGPSCGRPAPYPGTVRDDSPALADCTEPRRDVFLDFAFTDDYVARS